MNAVKKDNKSLDANVTTIISIRSDLGPKKTNELSNYIAAEVDKYSAKGLILDSYGVSATLAMHERNTKLEIAIVASAYGKTFKRALFSPDLSLKELYSKANAVLTDDLKKAREKQKDSYKRN